MATTSKDMLKQAVLSGRNPRFLYKYMPINEHTKSSLKERYLWFAKFEDFNDPYEGKVRKDHNYTKYDLEAFIKKRQANLTTYDIQQLLSDADSYIDKGMKETYNGARTCCFSLIKDNMLMWSHYADKHKGLCLEFDVLADTTDVFRLLMPVQYTNVRESCNYVRDDFSYIRRFALTKSLDWSYEKEYRSLAVRLLDQRFPFDVKMLKRVIFGCKTSDADIAVIKNLLPEEMIYSKCVLNEYEYKIDIIDV